MKKIMVLIVTLTFIASISTAALAANVSGEVTKVKGTEVTVEVSKSDAKKVNVGDSVKMKTQSGKKKPSAAGSALVGC